MDNTESISRRLSGIWLPLITPFLHGELDEASLARIAAHYACERIDGFILAATTGEGLVLDDEETERVIGNCRGCGGGTQAAIPRPVRQRYATAGAATDGDC